VSWADESSEFSVGVGHLASDDLDAATRVFDAVLQRDPKSADAYVCRGACHFLARRFNVSIQDLTETIRVDPKREEAYLLRYMAYQLVGERRKCDADRVTLDGLRRERGIDLMPRFNEEGIAVAVPASVLERATAVYRQADEWDRNAKQHAIAARDEFFAYYRDYLTTDSDDSAPETRQALALTVNGDFKNALTHWDRAIRVNSDNGDLYHHRGQVHALLRDYRSAEADFGRLIARRPNDPVGYLERGRMRVLLDHGKEAASDFQRASELASYDLRPRLLLAMCSGARGDPEAALLGLSDCVGLEPGSAVSYSLRGLANWQLTRLDEAAADLTESIIRDPRCADAYEVRARVYFAMGDIMSCAEDSTRAYHLRKLEREGGSPHSAAPLEL
jgi:tetratricopeptide (TPR) repeat protein